MPSPPFTLSIRNGSAAESGCALTCSRFTTIWPEALLTGCAYLGAVSGCMHRWRDAVDLLLLLATGAGFSTELRIIVWLSDCSTRFLAYAVLVGLSLSGISCYTAKHRAVFFVSAALCATSVYGYSTRAICTVWIVPVHGYRHRARDACE